MNYKNKTSETKLKSQNIFRAVGMQQQMQTPNDVVFPDGDLLFSADVVKLDDIVETLVRDNKKMSDLMRTQITTSDIKKILKDIAEENSYLGYTNKVSFDSKGKSVLGGAEVILAENIGDLLLKADEKFRAYTGNIDPLTSTLKTKITAKKFSADIVQEKTTPQKAEVSRSDIIDVIKKDDSYVRVVEATLQKAGKSKNPDLQKAAFNDFSNQFIEGLVKKHFGEKQAYELSVDDVKSKLNGIKEDLEKFAKDPDSRRGMLDELGVEVEIKIFGFKKDVDEQILKDLEKEENKQDLDPLKNIDVSQEVEAIQKIIKEGGSNKPAPQKKADKSKGGNSKGNNNQPQNNFLNDIVGGLFGKEVTKTVSKEDEIVNLSIPELSVKMQVKNPEGSDRKSLDNIEATKIIKDILSGMNLSADSDLNVKLTQAQAVDLFVKSNEKLKEEGFNQITKADAESIFPWMAGTDANKDQPITALNTKPQEEEVTVTENPLEAMIQQFMEVIQNIFSSMFSWNQSTEGKDAITKAVEQTPQQAMNSAMDDAGIPTDEREEALKKSIEEGLKGEFGEEVTKEAVETSVAEYRTNLLKAALEGKTEFDKALAETPEPVENFSLEGKKVKILKPDGTDTGKEITLTKEVVVQTKDLPEFQAAWNQDMEAAKTEIQKIANKDFNEVVKEAKRQLVTEKALEMYNKGSLPTNAKVEEVEIDGQLAKLTPVTATVNGTEETIGYVDVENGRTFTGDKTDVTSLKANQFDIQGKDGKKLELGAHPEAGLTGTMTAANLMDKQAEFTAFLNSVYNSGNPSMKAYKANMVQRSQDGVGNYPDMGKDFFAPAMIKYLNAAKNAGADLSQIELSPEMSGAFRDFLSKEQTFSQDKFIDRLRGESNDNIAAAIFDDPIMKKFDMSASFGMKIAPVNIMRGNKVVGQKDMERYGQLPFDEANFEVFKAAGGASSEAQVDKLIADRTKNQDQFKNATLGDLANAINSYNAGKELTNAQATLYTRTYLGFKAMGQSESQIEESMAQMAKRIADNGAERRLIVNPKEEGIEERDFALLNNISRKLGDNFNINQARNMDIPPQLRIDNQISRDVRLNSNGIQPFRNRWQTQNLFEALPREEQRKIFQGFKRGVAADYAYEEMTDIGLQAGQQASRVLTGLIKNGDIRNISDAVLAAGFKNADEAIEAYPEEFHKYIEDYYVHKSDEVIAGAKIEGKAGEKNIDRKQYKKPLEERDQYSSNNESAKDNRKEQDQQLEEIEDRQKEEKRVAKKIEGIQEDIQDNIEGKGWRKKGIDIPAHLQDEVDSMIAELTGLKDVIAEDGYVANSVVNKETNDVVTAMENLRKAANEDNVLTSEEIKLLKLANKYEERLMETTEGIRK